MPKHDKNWESIQPYSLPNTQGNSKCIYKEGYTLFYAEISDIAANHEGVKAKISAIPTSGLSTSRNWVWRISARWAHFSGLDFEYWHCDGLWTIYFHPGLVAEVVEQAKKWAHSDPALQDAENFFQLVQYINCNHEPRINRLEAEADMTTPVRQPN